MNLIPAVSTLSLADLPLHLTRIGTGDMLLEPRDGLDPAAAEDYLEPILAWLREWRIARLYYDVQQLAVIDPVYYGWLAHLARACQAMGVRMVAVHVRPSAAFTMSRYLQADPPFATALDVGG